MFEAKFQTFDDTADPAASAPRVMALRTELARRGLTGFVVPHADCHQSEYLPPSEERLAWLTGFTGSAGAAIVLIERAALFVDGRYTLQAREQVDTSIFAIEHLIETPPDQWIERTLTKGDTLGYDPWLHTVEGAEKLAKACANAGATLIPIEPNPIDELWSDRPAPPLGAVKLHDSALCGRSRGRKTRADPPRDRKAQGRRAGGVGPARGRLDLQHPRRRRVALPAAAVLRGDPARRTAVALYRRAQTFERRAPSAGRTCRRARARRISPAISSALGEAGKTVRLDQATGADALARLVGSRGGKVSKGPDPIALLKAVKNQVEIAGARAAHRRDGAAVTRFLAWFDREAPRGKLTEIGIVEALESFRRETGLLKDVSFSTIAGAGPDGAIVHYRVTRKTDRAVKPGDLVLIDSGGQYEDGTTDITRTVIVGRADRGDARPLHPRAQGPYRDRDSSVSRRHHRLADSIPSHGNRSGRPASISTTAPATASAAICRCTRAPRASPSSAPPRSSAA